MKYLVLDTNIYLHYKDVEQIEWKSILTNGEDFEIIVPAKVIEEIDNHKDQSKGKIQKRAKTISAKFGEYFLGTGNTAQVVFKTIDTPQNSEFERHNLMASKPDDVIVASALCMGVDVKDVIVVSGDNGILMTAKRLSMPFYKIIDSLRLADELSEDEKELQKIKKELDEYKNRLPKPKLTFANGSDIITLQKIKLEDHALEIERLVEEETAKYPLKTYDDILTSDNNSSVLFNFTPYTNEDIDVYNEDVDMYLRGYRTYVTNKFAIEDACKRTCELRFLYDNFEGKAPTGGGKILIEIDKKIQIFQRTMRYDSNQTTPPKLTTKFIRALSDISMAPTFPYNSNPIGRHYTQVIDFTKPTQGCMFEIDVDIIMQYDKSELKQNRINIDVSTCGNFSIDWIIIDKELPNPIIGKLNVVIK